MVICCDNWYALVICCDVFDSTNTTLERYTVNPYLLGTARGKPVRYDFTGSSALKPFEITHRHYVLLKGLRPSRSSLQTQI